MTLDNGNYGIVLVVLWVMQDLYHQPSTLNPIDPLKELLKGTLIDPFKGTHLIYITKPILNIIYSFQTLGIKIAQKPYIVWSLGPKALIYI